MFAFLLALALPRSVLGAEYRITSASEYTTFVNNVNKGTSYSGTTVLLDSDLSLSGIVNPIGTFDQPFSGVFDGQGHVISGLKVASSEKYVGMFGYSQEAAIRNIVLDSSCSITGSIDNTVTSGNPFLGGIMARYSGFIQENYYYIVENAVNMANVTFNGNLNCNFYIGGIIGYCYAASSAYVRNCVNYGTVMHSGSSSSWVGVGGIIGGLGLNYHIQNSLNYGPVTVTGTSGTLYIGGFVGYSNDPYIENCVSAGKMSVTREATETTYKGGFVGYVNSIALIDHCHFTNDVGISDLYGTNSPKTPNITESPTSPSTVNSALVSNLNTQATSNDWSRWVFNSNKASVAFNVNNSNRFSPMSSQLILLPGLIKSSGGLKFSGWYNDAHFTTPFTSNEITGAMTLYSGWEVTVTLNPNGGSVSPASKELIYNGLYGELPTPSRTGYTFTGWFAGIIGGDPISPLTVVPHSSSYSVYAQWTISNYTIKFEPNGGNPCPDLKQNYDTSLSLPASTRTGYTFVHWCSDPELTTEYTATKIEAKNITLYAKWEANKYIVAFDVNGGDELSTASKTVTYDEIYGELPEPTKTGYTFLGWFNDNNESSINETTVAIPNNHTLHAQWEANKYIITFESSSGSVCPDLKQEYGTSLSLPAPTRTGYTFVHWCSDPELTTDYTATKIEAKNITLYAKWEANKYAVAFDVNGGDELTTPSKTVIYDSLYGELPTPIKTGYTFTGWFNDNNESSINETTVAIPSNHTLHAHWSVNQYTITFDFMNGTKTEVTLQFGDVIEYPVCDEKEGYTFAGWNPNPETVPANDATTSAQWTVTKYIVTFDVNGGDELSIPTKIVTYDSIYGELPTPIKAGHRFIGWFNDNNETVTNETTVVIPTNHTLHAKWEEIPTTQVEIVFETKDLTEKEVEKIVRDLTDGEFSIIRYEDEKTGEIRIIIKFVDVKKAEEFVRAVRTVSGRIGEQIKYIRFGSEEPSGSLSAALFPSAFISIFFCF